VLTPTENRARNHLGVNTPTTPGKIERFHRTLRRKLLDEVGAFASIEAAQAAVTEWVHAYNTQRPHQSLDMATPASLFRPRPDHVGHSAYTSDGRPRGRGSPDSASAAYCECSHTEGPRARSACPSLGRSGSRWRPTAVARQMIRRSDHHYLGGPRQCPHAPRGRSHQDRSLTVDHRGPGPADDARRTSRTPRACPARAQPR
jgi:hypothetical protein